MSYLCYELTSDCKYLLIGGLKVKQQYCRDTQAKRKMHRLSLLESLPPMFTFSRSKIRRDATHSAKKPLKATLVVASN